MADETPVKKPVQSGEYWRTRVTQVLGTLGAFIGFDDPELIAAASAAFVAGAELVYLFVRRRKAKKEAA